MPRLSHEQIADRKNGMGSTDVVEVLGLSPWRGAGPMRVYLEKTTGEAPPAAEDEDGPVETEDEKDWGHVMEPIILAEYERSTGRKVIPCGTVQHPTEPWLFATLDATVIGEDRNLEIKNVGANMVRHWDAHSDDGVPRYVRAQVTIGMACLGKRLCDVSASVGGRPPHVWTVAYDEELATMLIDGGRAFWEAVKAGIAPPLDHTPSTKAYLRAKYPSNVDRVMMEVDNEIQALGLERLAMAQAEKDSKRRKDILDAEILSRVARADGVQGEGWKMTWKLDKNGMRRQRFTPAKEEE